MLRIAMASVIAFVCGLSQGIAADPAAVPTANPPSKKPPLIKLPVNFGHIAECTPVVFRGQSLLVLNYHDDALRNIDERVKSMHLCVQDLTTGREIARFGEGYTFVSALVEGDVLHVFASEERRKDIHHFWSTDMKDWKRELAIPLDGDELLYNSSVCVDDQGYLMAYESDKPVQFSIKFARSKDLKTWKKIDGLAYAGVDGKEYSACPVLRYFKPYYYIIHLHAAIPNHNGWVPFLVRSKDLATWQLSPLNPIMEAGPGEGCNNSDIDMFEQDGNTFFYYANGDQQTWYSLRMAMYRGTLKSFYDTCFPDGAPMTEVSAGKIDAVGASR